MSHRKFLSFTHYLMFLLLFYSLGNGLIAQQTKCPNLEDLLNKGYSMHGVDSHTPGTAANNDEFGIYDTDSFYVKVGNYPPVRAFYSKDYGCASRGYYMSYDLDIINPAPIPYTVTYNSPNKVYTYRTNGLGWQFEVIPPNNDFVSTFEGNEYDKSGGTPPWGDIVNPNLIEPYIAEPSVSIIGPTELALNETHVYTANIFGGSGDYGILWESQDPTTGTWIIIKSNNQAQDWFLINDSEYYFYTDEYKCSIEMSSNDINLRVTVFFNNEDLVIPTYLTIHPAPISIRFNNKIGTIENYGQLILDEIKTDPINSGYSRPLSFGTHHIVRTNELPFILNWQNTGKTEKHQYWALNDPLNLLNYSFEVTPELINELKANFIPTDPVTVRNLIDGVELSGSTIEFKDPWYYYKDNSNEWFQTNEFKPPYQSPFVIQNNSSTSYGGVFLNQGYNPITYVWTPPYYSVRVQQTQNMTLGAPWGARPAYFLNWSGANVTFQNENALTTPVVFNLAGAVATANYKGHLMSNSSTASAYNGQRKIVCDRNGIYHMVYHSMNALWYTKSLTTNLSGAWAPETKLTDSGTDVFANPSIDVNSVAHQPYNDDYLKVAFEYSYVVGESAGIRVLLIDINTGAVQVLDGVSISYDYYGNAKPVVASFDNEVFVIYKESAASNLKYFRYYLDGSNWINSLGSLSGTSASSINPTVAANNQPYQYFNNRVHIAWQEGSTYIKYQYSETAGRTNMIEPRTFSTIQLTSFGSGNTYNTNPSIIDLNGGARVVWHGTRVIGGQVIADRLSFREATGGGFWHFGSNVSSPVINKKDDNTAYILAWSQNDGTQGCFADNTLSQIHDLQITGKDMQLCNGDSFSTMFATSFTNTTLPYFFTQSNDIQNLYTLAKANIVGINKGREGVVAKGSGELYFTIGDVNVNGENISFTTLPDSFTISSVNDINNNVRTIPFAISDNSQFNYSVQYGITDSAEVANSLSVNDVVSFRVEIVDEATNEVLGVFDNVSFTKQQVIPYDNFSYQVSTEGIGNRTVYLRLVTSATEGCYFSLANLLDNQNIIAKKAVKQIAFKSAAVIKDYAMEQNYPNPFNPVTAINYQIPKSGSVTLKIFDILGKEVKILVNEQKEMGRYTVQFDASSLASGMYVYQLRANDYTSIKKMLLLK